MTTPTSSVPSVDPLLADLTPPQIEAVTHTDGPLLIVAAAGSGKTRVITRRVAHLLRSGVEPASILAITFTNKAASEMKQRISAASPTPMRDWGRLDQPWPLICTFHSLCLRILKFYAPQIGLPASFSIFDSADQNKLIKEAFKSLELSTENFTPASVHATISNAKNKLIDAEAFSREAGDFFGRTAARIYSKYQQLLKNNNAMDFDDLLMKSVQAMRDHPAVLADLQTRFRYILIDEYQDTNHAQYVLAHAMAMQHRNICVVGDPDQSIYAWRGADLKNILDFEKDYPDATVVRLEQNYRSTQTILAIADKLISHNTQRKEKKLWTQNAMGEKAMVLLCRDEHDEAAAVAEELIKLQQKTNIPWSDMAIFYRINAMSRVIEDALRRAEIPYQIARGTEFYGRKEIKDVLAYLRAVANDADEVSLTRIVNVPTRGIGDSSVKLLTARAVGSGISLWQAMVESVEGQSPGLSSRGLNAVRQFVGLMQSFREKAAALAQMPPPTETVDPTTAAPIRGKVQTLMEEIVRRSGMEGMLRAADPDGENEVANVNELINAAAEYDRENPEGSLEDYLSRVSLVADADHVKGSGGSVTMMTLHSAKGLEFPVVAMLGLEEGCLPHMRAQEDMNQLEEERRLCFVGITRARKRLILSRAGWRTVRGMRQPTATSQFLAQMPRELLDVHDRISSARVWDSDSSGTTSDYRSAYRPAQSTSRPATISPNEPIRREVSSDISAFKQITLPTSSDAKAAKAKFHVGQRVSHPKLGFGRILEISNAGAYTRAVVEFNREGRRTMILESAPLTPG